MNSNLNHESPQTINFKKCMLLLLMIASGLWAKAQPCPDWNGNVSFTTQAEVDAWPPCYTHINGGFFIGTVGTDIHDLTPLSNVTTVSGGLAVQYTTQLLSLEGLSVTSVGGNLLVAGNTQLSACCEIYELINTPGAVGGAIFIFTNPAGCGNIVNLNESCEDADGDGVNLTDGDCDDNDANNFPGNAEICDGLDNNCNGVADEGISGFTFTGNVTFTSQTEVDAWLPCYSHINGTLTISGADISDLSPLSNIATIEDDLTIIGNPMLASLDDISGISDIRFFYIEQNPLLTTIDGFNGLTTLGRLQIVNNASLVSVNGFNSLTSVADRFRIRQNASLSSINGLSNLNTAGRTEVSNNSSLTNIDGLSSLSQVTFGFFAINSNTNLTNLDGLAALTSVNGSFSVLSNGKLTDCCGIHDLLNTPGAITGAINISSNDTGCDSEPQIDEYCGDGDGDGFNIFEGDCMEGDPNIFPGAPEVCNGLDDDCDGQIDEGVTTYTGNVTFISQADVDAWNSCYTVIDGHLTITGWNISDLSNLIGLVEVTGSINIYYNSYLPSLNGLDNLATVGGGLTIFYNFLLADCCAIQNLMNGGVAGAISIFFNAVGCNSPSEILTTCVPQLVDGGQNGVAWDQNTLHDLMLFPNPAGAEVTVKFERKEPVAVLRIADLLGRIVYETELAEGVNRLDIDLNKGQFRSGVYLVSFVENGEMITKQLVVK